MKKKHILAITIGIAGFIWTFAVAAYTMLLQLPWLCWGSITCTVIATMAVEAYLLFVRKELGEQDIESGALGVIVSLTYYGIVLVMNGIFVRFGYGTFNWILLALNVVGLGSYIALLLWVEKSTAKQKVLLEVTAQKTAPTKEISRKLGELLAVTKDPEIRERLLKLKEAVDYGTNISTAATWGREEQMGRELDEIEQLTIGRADRLIILNKLEAAEMTWKLRSSAASTTR